MAVYYKIVSQLNGLVLDVDHGQHGSQLQMWPYNGTDNQLWRWDGSRLVSKSGLAADIEGGGKTAQTKVIAYTPHDGPNQSWRYTDGAITSNHCNLVLDVEGANCSQGAKIQIFPRHSGLNQKWSFDTDGPKPATSCYLYYKGISANEIQDNWTLVNTCRVKTSADCTYFCVLGWSPGGYSGIQQINKTRRVAIFSMWDKEGHKVKRGDHGHGVKVTTFGGEGDGLQAMKDVQWEEEELVTFKVTGERDGATWKCSCEFKIGDRPWEFMASYYRDGQMPLSESGFYSFVEDWDRSDGAEGHLNRRCAEFSGTKIISNEGEKKLDKAIFTKVMGGDDAYAQKQAFSGVKGGCFLLSTGGQNVEYQYENNSILCIK